MDANYVSGQFDKLTDRVPIIRDFGEGRAHSLYAPTHLSEPRMAIAFVLLNVNLGTEEEVVAKLREVEGVKEAYQIFGVYDIITRLEAENTDKVRGILQERVRKLDNIKSTLTLMAV
jgi:DNA-binding Lrp family transcriptional regulator